MSNSPVNTVPTTGNTTIDFSNAIGTSVYEEDGFRFTTNSSNFSGPRALDMVGTSSTPSTVTVTSIDGGTFDAASIQVSEMNTAIGPTPLSFTGTLAGGGSVTQNYTTLPVFQRELVNLNGFNNLSQLTFTTNFTSFDDLVLSSRLTATEDTPLAIEGISVNDADGNLTSTELTVENGTLSVDLSGGATITQGANNTGNLTLGGSQTEINAALATVSYQGNANYSGADTLTVLSSDGSSTPLTDSDQILINVLEVEDNGIVNTVPSSQLIATEDTALAIGGLSVADTVGSLETTQLSVDNGMITVDLAGGATISSGENGTSSLSLSGSIAEINAALATVTYQGNTDFNGDDTLTVLSTGTPGTVQMDSDDVLIDVLAVNDTPEIVVNTVPTTGNTTIDFSNAIGTVVYEEDGFRFTTNSSNFSGPRALDMVGTSSTPSTVTVTSIDGGTFDAASIQVSEMNTATGPQPLSFTGTLAGGGSVTQNYTTLPVFQRELVNLNGFNNLSQLTFTTNFTSFDDLVLSSRLTATEDTPLAIEGISVNDADGNLTSTELTVENGTLSVDLSGGATITQGANNTGNLTLGGSQTEINAALATVSYQGNANYSGADTLTVLSSDGSSTPLTDSDQILINVVEVEDNVNDAPEIVLASGTVNFDGISGVTPAPYEENGFRFTTTAGSFTGPFSLGMAGSNGFPYTLTATALDGGAFDANSIQVAEGNGSTPPQGMTFTGVLASGGTVSQSYTTSTDFVRELVELDGFDNIVELRMQTGFTTFDNFAFERAQSFSIAENTANGIVAGTVLATDVDSSTLQDWTIVGGSGQSIFSIDPSGNIKVSDTTQLDFETNNRFTLDLTVSDGVDTSEVETVVVNLTNVNEAPVLDLNGPNEPGADYTSPSNAYFSAAVDSSLSITEDTGGTLIGATAMITNPLNGADEFLSAQTAGTAITATYDPVEGILELTGEASAADYEQVLRTVQYTNTAGVMDGRDRTIEFTALDGEFVSFATSTLNFATKNGTAGRDVINGNVRSEIISGFADNDILRGRGGDDHLKGGEGNDLLFGDSGADHLDGGEGNDGAYYIKSTEAVTIDLASNSASGGDATGDTFNSIERVYGSNFDDTLIGDDKNNLLVGLAGADIIDGGQGTDGVNYRGSDAAVSIDLGTNSASGGHATGDSLSSIEKVLGSNFGDTLVGDNRRNILIGFDGDDTLDGSRGNDVLDGRVGADIMTGGIGSDTFKLKNLSDSLLTGFDVITDLNIDLDAIDTQNALSSAQINQLGAVNALTETDLQAVLTEATFIADEAATFTLGSRTFLAVNDGQNGYSVNQDAIVEITGFSGELANLTTV